MTLAIAPLAAAQPPEGARFMDARQAYTTFVHTTTEKARVSEEIARQIAGHEPHSRAYRLFDAGLGDGTVLMNVLRELHAEHENTPFYVVGKEISVEDVRMTLQKLPDRLAEHPATVFIVTNMNFVDAANLYPRKPEAIANLVWKDVRLDGRNAASFQRQLSGDDVQDFLDENWRNKQNPGGLLVPEKPTVLVISREDQKRVLGKTIPQQGFARADYDLSIASQPWRSRATAEFKAKAILGPLANSLAPGGKLIAIQSTNGNPASEIVKRVWPGENPFPVSTEDLVAPTKTYLGTNAEQYEFSAKGRFIYKQNVLPGVAIGTPTVMAAWNNAVYVGQIDDARISQALHSGRGIEVTEEVLAENNGQLHFTDEVLVIERKPEAGF